VKTERNESYRISLTNLLLNSVEAIDGGGGSVEIQLSAESVNRARVEITDTGRGIAPDDIAKYSSLTIRQKRRAPVCLAIVKKAIDDHAARSACVLNKVVAQRSRLFCV